MPPQTRPLIPIGHSGDVCSCIGGLVVIQTRAMHLEEVEDLRDNLWPIVDSLILDGSWKPVENKKYLHVDSDAELQPDAYRQRSRWILVYRKL